MTFSIICDKCGNARVEYKEFEDKIVCIECNSEIRDDSDNKIRLE